MGDLQEKIVKSTEVFRGRLLQVKVEDVILADGETARREVVYHPGAIAVVPINSAGNVVLVRQFRLPTGKALLEIPAGVLNNSESPEDCARRELAEEIGMHPHKLEKLCAIYLAPGYSNELIHIFIGQELEAKSAQADADERLELVEMPLSQALGLIDRGEIQDAKTIAGLLLAMRKI